MSIQAAAWPKVTARCTTTAPACGYLWATDPVSDSRGYVWTHTPVAHHSPAGLGCLLSACPAEQAGYDTEHPQPHRGRVCPLDTLPYICIINSTERPQACSAQGQLLCQTPQPQASGSALPPSPCHPQGGMELGWQPWLPSSPLPYAHPPRSVGMGARTLGSAAWRTVPPFLEEGGWWQLHGGWAAWAMLVGAEGGLLSPAQDEATATPGQHPFLDAPHCPTTPSPPVNHSPGEASLGSWSPKWDQGSSGVRDRSPGRSGGPGYILTCYHGNGSGSVAVGRGGCSSPEMLTKGRGKGARLRQGRPWGAASTPSWGLQPQPPPAAPKEAVGTARPIRPRTSPLLPSPPSSPTAVPAGSLGMGSGETPAKTLPDTLAKTGRTGAEAASPDQTLHCCHFMSPWSCHPGQGLP